ncbi:hypothetical protein LINPERPRIM_LOCUS35522, partial [Linum perenne]
VSFHSTTIFDSASDFDTRELDNDEELPHDVYGTPVIRTFSDRVSSGSIGMARRPSLRERQQVIASVIAMWFELMQQYMVLLSKLAVAQSLLESNRMADPTTIVLLLPREVYRRYHLNDWGRNQPRTKEENYNMRHSRARNVIECAFGILKMRWALLRDSSWSSPRMVSMITNACFLLHNFIRTTGGPNIFEQAYIPPVTQTGNQTTLNDPPPISAVESSHEWTAFRNELAETMWASRGRG